jgi:hypothetical protein
MELLKDGGADCVRPSRELEAATGHVARNKPAAAIFATCSAQPCSPLLLFVQSVPDNEDIGRFHISKVNHNLRVRFGRLVRSRFYRFLSRVC